MALPASQRDPGAVLRLRPLRPADETEFRAGHEQMAAQGSQFGLRLEPGMAWDDYLRVLDEHRAGVNLPERFVPSTFLIADVAGQIVGRVSIRHKLNEYLRLKGGHIGYSVLPAYRRRGYGTEILRQALVLTQALGIDPAMLTCDDDNTASIRVIEACGGTLEDIVPGEPGSPGIRRYWIG